jgi:HAMP domain-containing protein
LTLGTPKLLQSRVGRRVLVLLIVTALLPLATLALLSLTQVRNLLQQQATARLANSAKAYATGVYDRLLTARDVASLIAAHPSDSATNPYISARGFTFVTKVGALGKTDQISGIVSEEIGKVLQDLPAPIPQGGTALVTVPGGAFYLLHRQMDRRDTDMLIGKLDPKYVWGEPDDRKASVIICVAERETNALLYCPDGESLDLQGRLARLPDNSDLREVLWKREDVAYRGLVWAQFMKNDFGRPDWYFAVSVPEDEVFAAFQAFRSVFFPVVLLALLLIALLSIRQVRAMLIPLASLTAATRRVTANDFDARANIRSDDEFGELADAFNSMSIRLGREFQVSRVHSEIDRRILERNALRDIIESTLVHTHHLLPLTQVQVVALDRDEPTRASLFKIDPFALGASRTMTIASVATPRDSWPDLSSGELVHYPVGDPPAQWSPTDWRQCSTLALVWGKTVCGWLMVDAMPDQNTLSAEDSRILGELAGRLAIAIASAWREDELYQRAHYDTLTGLPNRSLFNDRLQLEIARARRDGQSFAVMFVDLDHSSR